MAGVIVSATGTAGASRQTHLTLSSPTNLQTHTAKVLKPLTAALPDKSLGSGPLVQTNTTVPTTTYSITAGQNGQSYSFTLLGGNFVASGTGTTTVSTPVYPIVFTFSTGDVFDPRATNSGCGERIDPVDGLLTGPEFARRNWYAGRTRVDTGHQYNDAQMRESFWGFTNPGGSSPNWHLSLSGFNAGAIGVGVSSSVSQEINRGTCNILGEIDLGSWDSFVQNTLIPSVIGSSLTTTQFPIFLVKNVVFTQNSGSTCCVLGYHSAFNRGGNTQTYTTTDYVTDGEFGASNDVAVSSHEINEWSNDPFVNNPTPSWGHIGQVSGCQGNLETGDPLTGTVFAVKPAQIGGITYHLQELALDGWFYDYNGGTNGMYSTRGTFTSGATLCS